MEIKLKRVYDPATPADGLRVLVDKLWPRGVRKADLPIDLWAKDITPSLPIRQMFHADPEGNFERFSEAYTEELNRSAAFRNFVSELIASRRQTVTLLFAFRNPQKNHAVILKQCVERALRDAAR